MEIKKKAIWSFLLITIIVFSYSCQRSNQKTHSSIFQIDKSKSKIDTILWLKETRGIRDILEDSKGNFWFSSPDYIAIYDGENIKYFSEDTSLGIVGNIHEDQNGTIWIEDGFNIYRYDGERFLAEKLDVSSALNPIQSAQYSLWVQKGLINGYFIC